MRSKMIPLSVRWSFLLFVLTLPFETLDVGFARDSLSVSKVACLLFFGCYFLFCSPFFGKRPFPRPFPALWWFLGYLAIYWISALFIDPQFAGMAQKYVVTFLQLVVFLWITTDLLKNQRMRENTLLTYAMSTVCLAVGIIFGLPGFETSTAWDGRTTAFGANANEMAGIMAIAVLILVNFRVKKVFKHFLSKILFPVLTLPLLLIIVKTGSRTGALALVCGFLVYFLPYWRSKRSMTVIIIAICGIGALLYLIATNPHTMERWKQARTGDLSERDKTIPIALAMISERPIFGWHPVASAYEINARRGLKGSMDAHNLLLSMLAEVGVVGTIPFFVGLWLSFRAAWMSRRGDLGLMPLSLLLAVLALHMGNPLVLWKPFWLVMGLTLATTSTPAMKQASSRDFFWPAHP